MNKVILMGRLTRNPDIRYSHGENQTCIARYTLAVDRRFRRDGNQDADFISCVTFGKSAEFAEKYLKQGTKIAISGRIQTGSYTNRDGVKVYTTEVVVEDQEFAESKAAQNGAAREYQQSNNSQTQRGCTRQQSAPENNMMNYGYNQPTMPADSDGFMTIPDDIEEELPFI